MRILFFIESLNSGGKERRLVELIKGLSSDSSNKMEIALIREGIHYEDIFSVDIKIHNTFRKKNVKKDSSIFFKFYKIARKFKPDIIHVWSNINAIYALPTVVLLRIPMINSQITNATPQESRSILSHRLTFPFSKVIAANTYAGIEAYKVPKNKSIVIYNGFDFDRINSLDSNSSIRKRFNIHTKYVVGMVANFTFKKDYKTYIDSANIILRNNKDITFLCVGSGNSDKYKKIVPDENKDNILFLGKQNQVESIMNICDIGVLLTDGNHNEGISNAILEFSALSKPVIATNGGGTGEIIEHNISGLLILDHSSEELVKGLLDLLKDHRKRIDFGQKANEIVIQKFNIFKMVSEFKNIYKKALL